jgi:hypothetical protein
MMHSRLITGHNCDEAENSETARHKHRRDLAAGAYKPLSRASNPLSAAFPILGLCQPCDGDVDGVYEAYPALGFSCFPLLGHCWGRLTAHCLYVQDSHDVEIALEAFELGGQFFTPRSSVRIGSSNRVGVSGQPISSKAPGAPQKSHACDPQHPSASSQGQERVRSASSLLRDHQQSTNCFLLYANTQLHCRY